MRMDCPVAGVFRAGFVRDRALRGGLRCHTSVRGGGWPCRHKVERRKRLSGLSLLPARRVFRVQHTSGWPTPHTTRCPDGRPRRRPADRGSVADGRRLAARQAHDEGQPTAASATQTLPMSTALVIRSATAKKSDQRDSDSHVQYRTGRTGRTGTGTGTGAGTSVDRS